MRLITLLIAIAALAVAAPAIADKGGNPPWPARSFLVADPTLRLAPPQSLPFESVGFAGHQASTARQAVEDVATEELCCVLLDVHLPDLSGYEVCQSLKTRHGRRLPVIFVSGDRTAAIDRVTGFLLGADDYIAAMLRLWRTASTGFVGQHRRARAGRSWVRRGDERAATRRLSRAGSVSRFSPK